jgi:cation diffusion facilitator family transporter
LHVLADALTSLLAIFALLSGKYLGALWLDPAMGIVGAILVARWSYGLIRETSRILLDIQADESRVAEMRESIEQQSSDRVTDLHVWSIGIGIFAAEIVVVSRDPKSPEHYKSLIPSRLRITHSTVEVHRVGSR